MRDMNYDKIRQAARERYGNVEKSNMSGCGCGISCCDGETDPEPNKVEESVASGCGCTTSCCGGVSLATAE